MRLQGRPAVIATAITGAAAVVIAAGVGIFVGRSHAPATTAPKVAHAHIITAQPSRFLGVSEAPLRVFYHDAGVKANLSAYYLTFGRAFPLHTVEFNAKAGALTLVEIEPRTVSMADIAAGRYDTWLHYMAASIKASGDMVLLSFAPEANGAWYSWGRTHTTAATFVAAWRHVHKVIGTRSVLWVWQVSPYAPHIRAGNPRPLWPGPGEADIVGLDGYYYTPGATFNGVFGRTIHYVRTFTSHPVLITETAVGPRTRHQAADIKALFAAVRSWSLLGIVWFDRDQHSGIFHQRWRFQDSPAAMAAFRQAAAQFLK
jgi:hypothetical protein